MKQHPLRPATDADLKEQFDLAIQIRDKVSEANNAVDPDPQRQGAGQGSPRQVARTRALKAAGDKLTPSLSAVEEEIYQVKNQSNQDPLNFPIKINNRLASLLRVVEQRRRQADRQRRADLQGSERRAEGADRQAAAGPRVGAAAFNAEAKRAGVAVVTAK